MFQIYVHDGSESAGHQPESTEDLSSPSSLSSAGRLNLSDMLGAQVQRPGGSAAFLDINYGKAVGDQVARPGGSAAFLDINYGKAVGDQVARPESTPGSSGASTPGLSIYIEDGHVYIG